MKDFKTRVISSSLSMVIVAGFLFPLLSAAQDVRFTQSFFSNPLRVNPAVMGMNSDLKVILNTRNQWNVVQNGYKTYSFTGIYPLYLGDGARKLDIGANVLSDKAGAFGVMDFALALGYNLKLASNSHLSFSMLAGYVQKSLTTADLTFDEQYVLGSFSSSNPNSETILNDKISYSDIGFGAMWYYSPEKEESKLNVYFGVAGFHLNEPNETLIGGTGKLPMKVSYQGGVKIFGENKIDVTPNVRVTTQKGSEEVAAGVYVDYTLNETAKIILGSWYRTKEAIAFLLAFEHNYFNVGYSYDITTSEISNSITGLNTHEITLSFKMNMADKKGLNKNNAFF